MLEGGVGDKPCNGLGKAAVWGLFGQDEAPVAAARGGRLWCVFGAGGDRDPGKRPLMGFAAEQVADRLVITSDNPRSESPEQIINQVLLGISRTVIAEADRRDAIRNTIDAAAVDDIILIAGKGHEAYQIVGASRLPFSDQAEARTALRLRRERQGKQQNRSSAQ